MYNKLKPILPFIIWVCLLSSQCCIGQNESSGKGLRLSGSVSFNTILNSIDSIEARRPGFSLATLTPASFITGHHTAHVTFKGLDKIVHFSIIFFWE